jgi:hypothetical protein
MDREMQELIFDIQDQISYNEGIINEFKNLNPRCDYGIYRNMEWQAQKAQESNDLLNRCLEVLHASRQSNQSPITGADAERSPAGNSPD